MADLFLIPAPLGENDPGKVIPGYNIVIIKSIKHFIVENIRTARRFLKKLDPSINIDEIEFYELNEHTAENSMPELLKPIQLGFDTGIISEAGCPGIADPGGEIVRLAHERDIRVIPLVGPSSVLLSLIASGMNGQNFCFLGYLPSKQDDRIKAIRQLERRSASEKQTQIFIETPYRNMKLLHDLISNLDEGTRLCIAVDLTLDSEFIKTQTVARWKKKIPDLNKRPAIFLVSKD